MWGRHPWIVRRAGRRRVLGGAGRTTRVAHRAAATTPVAGRCPGRAPRTGESLKAKSGSRLDRDGLARADRASDPNSPPAAAASPPGRCARAEAQLSRSANGPVRRGFASLSGRTSGPRTDGRSHAPRVSLGRASIALGRSPARRRMHWPDRAPRPRLEMAQGREPLVLDRPEVLEPGLRDRGVVVPLPRGVPSPSPPAHRLLGARGEPSFPRRAPPTGVRPRGTRARRGPGARKNDGHAPLRAPPRRSPKLGLGFGAPKRPTLAGDLGSGARG
jgi:hypothetical protein